MKAAIFYKPRERLQVEIVPTPKPAPGEVLLKVAACGVCRTDLNHIDRGDPTVKSPPLILGHEVSGTVAELGPGVTNYKKGDHVLAPATLSCGTCYYCRSGRENLCENMQMFGNHRDGGYAEFMTAPAKDLFLLPSGIPLIESCLIAHTTTTPFHAVHQRANVHPGDSVAVYGCGGIGLNAVQVAAAVGATVIAVDILPAKLDLARSLGASFVVNAQAENVPERIRELTHGGADIALECIGNPQTQQDACASLRAGGRLVMVGHSAKAMALSGDRVMSGEMEIVGSADCLPTDYPRVIDWVRRGKIKTTGLVSAQFPLEDINRAFDMLRRGEGVRTLIALSGAPHPVHVSVQLDESASWLIGHHHQVSVHLSGETNTLADVVTELTSRFSGIDVELKGQTGDQIPYRLFLNDESVHWGDIGNCSVKDGDQLRVMLPAG